MSAKSAQLELEAHQRFGSHIGWMANVINVSHSSPVAKIRGLIALAEIGAVASVPFSMDHVLIDGKAVSWTELENYQPGSQQLQKMRRHYLACGYIE